MRALPLFALLLAFSGCGETKPPRALSPVRLTLEAPTDRVSVTDDSVEVRGTVAPPRAQVLVAGDEADVDGGAFSATVALDTGTNVIDVQAGAPGRAAAMAAVRVSRVVLVTVPDVEGFDPDDASDALADANLDPEIRDESGPLDDFLFGAPGVCATEPGPDAEVAPGTTVTVVVAGGC